MASVQTAYILIFLTTCPQAQTQFSHNQTTSSFSEAKFQFSASVKQLQNSEAVTHGRSSDSGVTRKRISEVGLTACLGVISSQSLWLHFSATWKASRLSRTHTLHCGTHHLVDKELTFSLSRAIVNCSSVAAAPSACFGIVIQGESIPIRLAYPCFCSFKTESSS